MKSLALGAMGLAAAAATAPASAATLTWTGAAVSTCALSGASEGVITLQGDLSSWSTTSPASILAVNTAPATVTVTRPTTWALSPANAPSTTFGVSGVLSGQNNGVMTGDNATRNGALTNIGSTTVAVSLSANGSAAFPTGAYTAQATVTCVVP